MTLAECCHYQRSFSEHCLVSFSLAILRLLNSRQAAIPELSGSVPKLSICHGFTGLKEYDLCHVFNSNMRILDPGWVYLRIFLENTSLTTVDPLLIDLISTEVTCPE
jgi:hypothetical protein